MALARALMRMKMGDEIFLPPTSILPPRGEEVAASLHSSDNWLQPQQLPDQGVYLRNLVLQKLTHLAAATGHGFHR